ncbi:MAG: MBL fold metallo-hydrolase [Pirellulales bacterium]|jgi:7,8-dihydropterin-6-yl-methyl-4-(beta-D-ribofuranosyl)aminobenzene 5'-phosphate synthase|nr:MBL fold metallo-hydrolase [Thermoguttaceae bacterium]MDD4786784.1 MBL fold metallo-hydrolase [Pirellulales bacterium]MDI9442946.1 MBL fold metallo-hydrolase [Planctomycetota bacterium]NLZ01171.1 MBL fold metallo-hydrolase [Pirellulaceae bacterium]
MTEKVRITVLVENTAESPGLLAEHGLAFWIEVGSQCVLFDTGQGSALAHNAYRLRISANRADALVLSHGHYDHTGGLADVLRGNHPAAIYAHPDAFQPKFAQSKDGSSREIGIPYASAQAIQRHRDRLVLAATPTRVADGLIATGAVPRVTEFEDTGGRFFLDARCQTADPLSDDQAIFFESTRGLVVLLGCAHAGVINTLRYVRQLTAGRPIHAVLGGMHLLNAPAERLDRTIGELREMKIDRLGPAHCTGRAATAALWNALPDRCVPCHVGTQFEFDLFSLSAIGVS